MGHRFPYAYCNALPCRPPTALALTLHLIHPARRDDNSSTRSSASCGMMLNSILDG